MRADSTVNRLRLLLALLILVAPVAGAEQPLSAYITGGIGLEERRAMQASRGQFNLQLTFALTPSGNYASAVETLIAQQDGTVILRVTSDGPFVWARLAPGAYGVAATYRGRTLTRRVAVPPKGVAAEAFYWSDSQAAQ